MSAPEDKRDSVPLEKRMARTLQASLFKKIEPAAPLEGLFR
jgi:hypothetical protein